MMKNTMPTIPAITHVAATNAPPMCRPATTKCGTCLRTHRTCAHHSPAVTDTRLTAKVHSSAMPIPSTRAGKSVLAVSSTVAASPVTMTGMSTMTTVVSAAARWAASIWSVGTPGIAVDTDSSASSA